MSENSKIEWTTHTYNPWIGCTKVSPGCANCYAESEDKRRGWTPEGWGKGKPRKRTKTAKDVEKWNREAADAPDRPRVFCSSLADWLDDEVPIEWLADLLELIRRTPNLDWLLLTKRPENWRGRLGQVGIWACGDENEPATTDERHPIWQFTTRWLFGNAPDNVWLGTSVEDQQRADERIPVLLEIPAKVRFLSVEPLLGPVDFARVPGFNKCGSAGQEMLRNFWVIVGGESGPKARPFDINWARSLRDQCSAAGVAFFLKQLGAKPHEATRGPGQIRTPEDRWVSEIKVKALTLRDKKGGDIAEWPEDLRIRQFPNP